MLNSCPTENTLQLRKKAETFNLIEASKCNVRVNAEFLNLKHVLAAAAAAAAMCLTRNNMSD
jgi:hypothetical protein